MSTVMQLPCDIVEGDIGQLAVDGGPWLAVVSSDDNYLSHGGGCSRSLWQRAQIDSAGRLGVATPVRLGDVIVTPAGALPAGGMFHVVTLDLDTRQALTPDLFEAAMQTLADLVKEARLNAPQGPSKILLPLLGTGAAGIAERIAVEQLSRLSILTHEADARCVVCVPNELSRLQNEFVAAFGVEVRNNFIEAWLGSLTREPKVRVLKLVTGLEKVLTHVAAATSGLGDSPPNLRAMWFALRNLPEWAVSSSASADWRRIEDSLDLRNRIVHGVMTPDAMCCHTLEVGLRALVAQSLSLAAVTEESLRNVLSEVVDWPAAALRSNKHAVTKPPSSNDRRAEWLSNLHGFVAPNPADESGGSLQPAVGSMIGHRAEHVNRLVDLLLSLPRDDLDHMADTLAELGYKGELRLQIKEYCVRQDPVAILSQFGAVRLKKLLAENFGEVVPAKKTLKWMSRRLLHHLGFRMPGMLRSLEAVASEVSRLESELLATDDPRGLVLKASARLEGCIHDLLRFVCLHLFAHGPEQHFKGHVNGVAAFDLSKATLGSLLHCLELLARELEQCAKSDTKKVLRELQGPLTARRLAPGGVSMISQLRNSFAHFDDESGDRDDVEAAREFFRGTMSLLKHWADESARIYPIVIRVKNIIVDEWNRRRIEAVTAEGRMELIVCDKAVEPGGIYFMYPLSNPFRVDPILIEFNP